MMVSALAPATLGSVVRLGVLVRKDVGPARRVEGAATGPRTRTADRVSGEDTAQSLDPQLSDADTLAELLRRKASGPAQATVSTTEPTQATTTITPDIAGHSLGGDHHSGATEQF